MAYVITEDSAVACMHQGKVKPAAAAVSAVLSVGGKGVLVGTLASSTVGSECTQPNSSSSTQCTSIATQTAGPSSVLFAGGKAVLLDSAAGTTNGAPTNIWSVEDAKQSVLGAA